MLGGEVMRVTELRERILKNKEGETQSIFRLSLTLLQPHGL